MTDRQLANAVYCLLGIPMADWPLHYAQDSATNDRHLRYHARKFYEAIFRSYRSE